MIEYCPSDFTILVIEDNAANLKVISSCLEEFGFTILIAQTSAVGLQRASYALPHLILLDVQLPDRDGYETCQMLKENPKTHDIPVIFMTALNSIHNKVQGFSSGAVDYIAKPFQQEELLARIRVHLQLNQFAQTLDQQNHQLQTEAKQRETLQELLLVSNQQLAQQRDFAHTTLASITEGVVATSRTGQIETFNPTAETITGWTEKRLRGKLLSEVIQLLDEDTQAPIQPHLELVINKGEKVILPEGKTVLLDRHGAPRAVEGAIAPILNHEGFTMGAVFVFRDVTQSRATARQLAWQASYDPLTQLLNRREFERRLSNTLATLKTQDESITHCLCLIDLDRFKLINDTCGHLAGDELLRQVSRLLKQKVRPTDIVFRLGGDEFSILLLNCSADQAKVIGNNICKEIQDFRFVWEGQTFSIGASLGIAPLEGLDITNNPTLYLNAADTACYAAKSRGGNQAFLYKTSDREVAQYRSRVHWVPQIEKALNENRFQLFSQTITPLQGQQVNGSHQEILLRMLDSEGNIISPGAFMPAAERYNLMPAVDRWVLHALFTQLANVDMTGDTTQRAETFSFAINLSGASINDPNFASFLQTHIERYRIPPETLCFEITETVAVANLDQAAQFIHRFKDLGCHFALDDFGSGMSSLTYLKKLPVDCVKIDGYFVQEMIDDPTALIMVETIHRLACALNMKTIAEFVSSEAIYKCLCNMGIHYAQGYYISKPQPLSFQHHKVVSPIPMSPCSQSAKAT